MNRLSIVLVLMLGVVLSAQPNPSTLPRLSASALTYEGAFRLPRTSSNGEYFSFGGPGMAYNPASNTLYVQSRGSRVAEVSIPALVNSTSIAALNFATYVQPFADPVEGRLSEIATSGVALRSLAVLGDRLCGAVSIYYDGNNTQTRGHFCRSLNLSTPSFSGWSAVWAANRTGFVAGPMAPVPVEWQTALGGDAITGNCCVPVTSRTSQGPAAFSLTGASIGLPTVLARPLVYYPQDHSTLGLWMGANPVYGGTTKIVGVALINGTRTAIYVGRNGLGTFCYGNGTANQALAGTRGPDGELYCYDPESADKAQHAYPYRNQVWLYDLAELAAAGDPWSKVPYEVTPLDLPFAHKEGLGGAAYDAARRRLYVLQMQVDVDGFSNRPLIHAFTVTVPAPSTTEPPAPPAQTLQQQLDALRLRVEALERVIEAIRTALVPR